MNDETKRQMIYLVTLDMLRRLAKRGSVDMRILERLNRKNAEKMCCKVLAI